MDNAAHNAYALAQFIAASGAFGGLAPQKLLTATRATPPESTEALLAAVAEANADAELECSERGDHRPIVFVVAHIPTDEATGMGPRTRIRYGGHRTFAQLEIVGDLWLYSLGIRDHDRVTADSAVSLAGSIAKRAACAAQVPAPAETEPEGLTVVRRSPLPEDAATA